MRSRCAIDWPRGQLIAHFAAQGVDGMGDEVVYRRSRRKSAIVLLASLVLTAVSAWMATEYPLLGGAFAAFFRARR